MMKLVLFAAVFALAATAAVNAFAHGHEGPTPVGAMVDAPMWAIAGISINDLVASSPPRGAFVYDQPIVIGEALPDACSYYDLPNYPAYQYTFVNNQRVIVQRQSRRVVRVIQ